MAQFPRRGENVSVIAVPGDRLPCFRDKVERSSSTDQAESKPRILTIIGSGYALTFPVSGAFIAGAAVQTVIPSKRYHSLRKRVFVSESSFVMGAAEMKDMRRIFAEWPASIPRTGLIVTTFGESIPFVTYMLSGDLLLVERRTPDAQGARRVILGIDAILAVKILDAIGATRRLLNFFISV